jgi:hypothetical protein
MAATPGSIYQVIAAAHQTGNPPNTDYQRATETYSQYVLRMSANELPPDINPTEDDATYKLRAGLVPSVINLTGQVWGYVLMIGANNWTASTTNCSISRSAIGTWRIAFPTPLNMDDYEILWNSYSGSVSAPTGSYAFGINKTPTGVTMSVANIVAPLVPADFTTASFSVRI